MNKVKAAIILLLVCLCFTFTAQGQVKPEEIQKMKDAMESVKPSVKVDQPRKMLVFSLCKGFRHSSIPYWVEALNIMAYKTKAFTVVNSTDMNVFNAEYLKQFDAICFNNTTTLVFTPEQRKALWDFVHDGKGIVGIHAATDNFNKWPEFQEIMGGKFTGHPWTAGGTWAFKIDDPTHPLTKAFNGKGFKISDEIYRTDPPLYDRSKARVLVSLDMSDKTTGDKRQKPEDDDVGVTWIKRVGKGRLFYSCLGHNNHLTWTSFVLQHYLDGIQYAMGDLKCNDTPVPPGAKAKGGSNDPFAGKGGQLTDLLAQIAKYNYGDSRESQTTLTEMERSFSDNSKALRALEQKYLEFIKSDATLAGKQFICRRLSIIGSEASAYVLADMLSKSETADMARYALELIPGKAIDKALRETLSKADNNAKIGIISTLGLRGDPESVDIIAGYVTSTDENIAAAAVTALGQIADPKATEALGKAKDKTKGDLQMQVLDAYLNCADSLEMDGDIEGALKIYKEIYQSDVPKVIKSAALRGLVFCSEKEAGKIIIDILQKADAEMTSVAVGLLGEISSDQEIKAIADEVKNLPPTGQIQLITALGNKGSAAGFDAVVKAASSEDQAVRIAAYKALARLGNAGTVTLLAKVAGSTSGSEREAVRDTLYSIRDPEFDKAVIDAIDTSDARAKSELIAAVGQRNIKSAVEVLFRTAKDEDRKVRLQSFKVLRDIAEEKDLPRLLELLMTANSGSERNTAETAVASACNKLSRDKAVDVLLNAMDSAPLAGKASLITLLGQYGGQKAYTAVRAGLSSSESEIKEAAIRSLAEFPDDLPADDLLELAKNSSSPTHKIIALRGYIHMIDLTEGAMDNKVEMCKTALALASRINEKRLVIAAASKIPDQAAKEFVSSVSSDASLKRESQAALKAIDELIAKTTFIRGTGRLEAKKGIVVGAGAVYDADKDSIGSYQDAQTEVVWDVVISEAGLYEIGVLQNMDDQAGSTYEIVLGKNRVQGTVVSSGNKYIPVRAGTMNIQKPGLYTVIFRPLEKVGHSLINLRAILFRKESKAGSEVILTGSDFSAWRQPTGSWQICGDTKTNPNNARTLVSRPGEGCLLNGPEGNTVYLYSKAEFGDCAAHIEFMVPQGSNSGVYFQGRYEIQIFDSWGVDKPKYSDCGGIYQRWKDNAGYDGIPPRENASLEPGKWQSFDVIFRAPEFDVQGNKISNAYFEKVIHNGTIVHENAVCTGPTRASVYQDEKPVGPLVLQGDHGPVSYRNIWVTPLD